MELTADHETFEKRFADLYEKGLYLYGRLKYPVRARAGCEAVKMIQRGQDIQAMGVENFLGGLSIPADVVQQMIFIPSSYFTLHHVDEPIEVFTQDDAYLREPTKHLRAAVVDLSDKDSRDRLKRLGDPEQQELSLQYSIALAEQEASEEEFERRTNYILEVERADYASLLDSEIADSRRSAREYLDWGYKVDLEGIKLARTLTQLYLAEMTGSS